MECWRLDSSYSQCLKHAPCIVLMGDAGLHSSLCKAEVFQSRALPKQMGLFAAKDFHKGETVLLPTQHWTEGPVTEVLKPGEALLVQPCILHALGMRSSTSPKADAEVESFQSSRLLRCG